MTEVQTKEVVVEGERCRPEPVSFASLDPVILEDVADPATRAATRLTTGELFLPDGELENRPAVVIVQGLGGQKPERELTYGYKLAKAGHVALAVDSFGARDVAHHMDSLKAMEVSTWSILADAFGALRFLARHPAVNPKAVSIMGFSWGGMVTVLSAYDQIRRLYLEDEDLRFAGHASYYGCSIPRLEDPTPAGGEVMVLVGAKDRNVSVDRSRQICQDLALAGARVDLQVFDAYHQWDGKDAEKRHVFGALSDIRVTITRDNRLIQDNWNVEVRNLLSQALYMILDLGWDGYDIQRDAALHRRTDRLLLDLLHRVAVRAGARPPDLQAVPLGAVGGKPDE